jgi:hypothetical protein
MNRRLAGTSVGNAATMQKPEAADALVVGPAGEAGEEGSLTIGRHRRTQKVLPARIRPDHASSPVTNSES